MPPEPDEDISLGTIAAIIVGGVAALGGVVFLAVKYWPKQKVSQLYD